MANTKTAKGRVLRPFVNSITGEGYETGDIFTGPSDWVKNLKNRGYLGSIPRAKKTDRG